MPLHSALLGILHDHSDKKASQIMYVVEVPSWSHRGNKIGDARDYALIKLY